MHRSLVIVASVLLFGLAGCVSSTPQYPGARGTIALKDDFFEPDGHSAKVGDVVTWKNQGRNAHTVTVQNPDGPKGDYLFNRELIKPGESVSYAFPEPRTYDVFCIYHSQGAQGNFSGGMVMKATVTG